MIKLFIMEISLIVIALLQPTTRQMSDILVYFFCLLKLFYSPFVRLPYLSPTINKLIHIIGLLFLFAIYY